MTTRPAPDLGDRFGDAVSRVADWLWSRPWILRAERRLEVYARNRRWNQRRISVTRKRITDRH